MKMREIQSLARGMGINSWGMRKVDLIRMIQETEGNVPCYYTDRVYTCAESECLWAEGCKGFLKKRSSW